MNYLARSVQIWFSDRTWADDVFDEIVSHIPEKAILKICKRKDGGNFCELTDESTIRMVCAKESQKACRGTEVYIQNGISRRTYQEIISPCIRKPGIDAFVISDATDLLTGRGWRASDYYNIYK